MDVPQMEDWEEPVCDDCDTFIRVYPWNGLPRYTREHFERDGDEKWLIVIPGEFDEYDQYGRIPPAISKAMDGAYTNEYGHPEVTEKDGWRYIVCRT